MSERLDFEFKEVVHESGISRVQRAVSLSDGRPVVLKILKDTAITPERLARFKREFEITSSLNPGTNADEVIDGVIAAIAYQTVDKSPTIILEDFGAVSLDLLNKSAWSLDEFFSLAIQVVEALVKVHARQIMHKDINPSNIVYNAQTGQS